MAIAATTPAHAASDPLREFASRQVLTTEFDTASRTTWPNAAMTVAANRNAIWQTAGRARARLVQGHPVTATVNKAETNVAERLMVNMPILHQGQAVTETLILRSTVYGAYKISFVIKANKTVTIIPRFVLRGGKVVTLKAPKVVLTKVQPGERFNIQAAVVGSTTVAAAWRAGHKAPAWQVTSTNKLSAASGRVGKTGFSEISTTGTPVTVALSSLKLWRLSKSAPAGAISLPPAQPQSIGTATTPFVHPGVLLGTTQLNFVKAKLAAGQEPSTSSYASFLRVHPSAGTQQSVPFASLSYVAQPVNNMSCSSGGTANQSQGCLSERFDATAAYADALVWYYDHNLGGNREAYAQKAIEIINAWSRTFTTRVYNGPGDSSASNASVQASWAGTVFAKAAEIIRYTYTPSTGKASLNVNQLNAMFDSAYTPFVNKTWPGGGANWLMSMAEATVNIGIFQDNHGLYDAGIQRWHDQLQSTIFVRGETNRYPQLAGYPVPPMGTMYDRSTTTTSQINTYWYNPIKYVDGLEGETCRDPAHMAIGLGPLANIAETARLQGLDLYREAKPRMVAALELNAGYIASFMSGITPSDWPCAKVMSPKSDSSWKVSFEIAYNQYAGRQAIPLPNTLKLLNAYTRPSVYKAEMGMNFEQLTSQGTP